MGLQFVPMATMDTILTRARLTATTGLTGLRAECLSALVRGMAGDGLGVGVAGAVAGVDAGSLADVGSPVDAVLRADAALHVVRLGASTAARFMAVAASTVAAAAGSTVAGAEDSTVAVTAAVAVAVTGKRGLIRSSLIW
jgi:hypothetical protein